MLLLSIFSDNSDAKPNSWQEVVEPFTTPPGDTAASIGTYTAGCVRGAVALPLSGTGYQLMRHTRKRFYGHPTLLAVVEELALRMKNKGLGPILIGDLGQPRGGPMPRGHASHQNGLDVDVWFWHPKTSESRLLTRKERRNLALVPIVGRRNHHITKYWSQDATEMIWLAAGDERVSRVLVNAAIKKRLCDDYPKRDALLRKIRPWYGHADHMHVRLQCPKGSGGCVNEDALPAGDGCRELDWWLARKSRRERSKGKAAYLKTVGQVSSLPRQCQLLLE